MNSMAMAHIMNYEKSNEVYFKWYMLYVICELYPKRRNSVKVLGGYN